MGKQSKIKEVRFDLLLSISLGGSSCLVCLDTTTFANPPLRFERIVSPEFISSDSKVYKRETLGRCNGPLRWPTIGINIFRVFAIAEVDIFVFELMRCLYGMNDKE